MYIKTFDDWNNTKKRIHKEKRGAHVRDGEIRWASIGINIGSEIDGKGNSSTRPVLIIGVVGSILALVVPLSTKLKKRTGYFIMDWKGDRVAFCIHQTRVISQRRILHHMGRMSQKKLSIVKNQIVAFFNLQ